MSEKYKFTVPKFDMPHQFDRKGLKTAKTITEAAREIRIFRETDVIVVGGGPGGTAAAVSAARGGAETILIERYGHLGGMATGGLVNIIPNLSNIGGEQVIGGFCQEVIERLAKRGAADFPEKRYWGKHEPSVVDPYVKSNIGFFFLRNNKDGDPVPLYTAVIDPEVAKDEFNSMVQEAGADLLLHSWVTAPIMEGNTIKGVIVENKAGRQALLGKVVIDSTGDGDLLPGSGVETIDNMEPGTRIAQFGFVYWICNVDLEKYYKFKESEPSRFEEVSNVIIAAGGSPRFFGGQLKHQNGVVWIHQLVGSVNQTDPEEMTFIDVTTRKKSVKSWELLKKHMPGFEQSFIMLSCPQLGTSGGRRIVGEYFLTKKDIENDLPFDDTIAIFAGEGHSGIPLLHPKTYVPYRALIPKGSEGLLVACRAFSADNEYSEFFNLIPHCMCFGQAAGTAAAISIKDGVGVRDVNFAKLRSDLLRFGAILP